MKKINNIFDDKALLAQQVYEKRHSGNNNMQNMDRKSVTQIEENNTIFLMNEHSKAVGTINPLLMDSVEESSNNQLRFQKLSSKTRKSQNADRNYISLNKINNDPTTLYSNNQAA